MPFVMFIVTRDNSDDVLFVYARSWCNGHVESINYDDLHCVI